MARAPLLALASAVIVAATLAAPAHAALPRVRSFTASVSDVTNVTLSWSTSGGDPNGVYIYDLTNDVVGAAADGHLIANGGNLAIGVQQSASGPSATISFRVSRVGIHRYAIDVKNSSGQASAKTAVTIVAPLPPPTVTSANPIRIDSLAPGTPTFTWTKQSGATSQLTFTHNGATTVVNLSDANTTSGSYTATDASDYAPAVGAGSRTTVWAVRQCTHGISDPTLLCSQSAEMEIIDGPARVTSGARVNVPPGQAATVTWNPGLSGSFYNLAATSIGYNQWTTGNSLSVPVPSNASGLIDLVLTECNLLTNLCANRFDPVAPVTGTITAIAAYNTFVGLSGGGFFRPPSDVVGTIQQGDGTLVDVHTQPTMGLQNGFVGLPDTNPATGQPFQVGDTITAGTPLVFVIVDDTLTPNAHLENFQILATTQTWATTPYTTDYTIDPVHDRWATWQDPNLGAPIWSAATANNTVYTIGEFSRGIADMPTTLAITAAHDVPILRKDTTSTVTGRVYRQEVNPFTATFGATVPAAFSVFTEEVGTDASGKLWFAQGGDGGFVVTTTNHSRIVSFDPAGTDDPSTVNDERFCTYNVPATSGTTGSYVYNTNAFGVTTAGNRVYFVEYRPHLNSALTWFIPSEFACGNDFDFTSNDTPSHYCASPSDVGCFHLTVLPNAIQAAYPVYDGTSVWIGEFDGALDRYDVATGTVTRYPVNATHRVAGANAVFGNIATSLAADANYVYYGGARDGTVNRFNKAMAAVPGGCTTLVNGNNPCIEQIFVPLATNELGGYMLSLGPTGRLWFTLGRDGNEFVDPLALTVGYVDTNNWGPGTFLSGLDTVGDPSRHNAAPSFFGANAAANGSVILPDYARGEVLRLWPNGLGR